MWQKIIFKCKIRVEKIIKLKFSFLSFHLMAQMALDGKAIKEEIPDKEAYDSGSVRRVKGEFPFWHFLNYGGVKIFLFIDETLRACKVLCWYSIALFN